MTIVRGLVAGATRHGRALRIAVAAVALALPGRATAQAIGIQVRDGDMAIVAVDPAGAAARAGFRVGDRVQAFAGTPVTTVAALRTLVARAHGTVSMRILRGTQVMQGAMTLGADDPAALRAEAERYEAEADRLIAAARGGTTAPAAAPVAAPTPAPAGGDGLPVGRYDCRDWAAYGGYSVHRRVLVTDAQSYVLYTKNDVERIPGRYRYDGKGRVAWLSGPLQGHRGDYEWDDVTKDWTLTIYEGTVPKAFICHRSQQ